MMEGNVLGVVWVIESFYILNVLRRRPESCVGSRRVTEKRRREARRKTRALTKDTLLQCLGLDQNWIGVSVEKIGCFGRALLLIVRVPVTQVECRFEGLMQSL